MDRSIALLGIGLVFGGGIGFLVAAANGVTLDGHDHGSPDAPASHTDDHSGHGADTATAGHDHDTLLSLPAGDDAPTLEIAVVKDPVEGWNLHVMAGNFHYAPEHASQSHVAGEGHAHVYVNGDKLGRLYGPWMHIGALPTGTAHLEVTLNSNDHRPLAIDGTPLSAKVMIENN